MQPLLEVKDLSVQYKNGNSLSHALGGVNLKIERGEALGLVGETGAGKTTTALSILNLLPKPAGKITGGEILFDGQPILKMSKKELMDLRGNKIAMIFQNPLTSLNPVFTIGEQIALVLRKHQGLKQPEAMKRAGEMLEIVGIPAYRVAEYPNQFSGGMRQRVGIAAALACNPALLIADEPTTALDVTIQAQILELMKDLQKQFSSSLLMITHSLGIIAEMCQKVAVMYAGVIIEYGTINEVFNHPAHEYTKGLIGAVPKLSGPRERLAAIPGTVANPEHLPPGCRFHPRCSLANEDCKTKIPPMIMLNANHYVAGFACAGGAR